MTSLSIWASNRADESIQEEKLDDPLTSTDITLKAQNELYLKEINELKSQLLQNQSYFADLKRQLDVSAIRITELERQVLRQDFDNQQLSALLKQSYEKISLLQDDNKKLIMNHEIERSQLLGDHKRCMLEKDTEILSLRNLLEASKDRQVKAEVFMI